MVEGIQRSELWREKRSRGNKYIDYIRILLPEDLRVDYIIYLVIERSMDL
jgi:hypothetical protein